MRKTTSPALHARGVRRWNDRDCPPRRPDHHRCGDAQVSADERSDVGARVPPYQNLVARVRVEIWAARPRRPATLNAYSTPRRRMRHQPRRQRGESSGRTFAAGRRKQHAGRVRSPAIRRSAALRLNGRCSAPGWPSCPLCRHSCGARSPRIQTPSESRACESVRGR